MRCCHRRRLLSFGHADLILFVDLYFVEARAFGGLLFGDSCLAGRTLSLGWPHRLIFLLLLLCGLGLLSREAYIIILLGMALNEHFAETVAHIGGAVALVLNGPL